MPVTGVYAGPTWTLKGVVGNAREVAPYTHEVDFLPSQGPCELCGLKCRDEILDMAVMPDGPSGTRRMWVCPECFVKWEPHFGWRLGEYNGHRYQRRPG